MPELPEVETIARDLQRVLPGQRIRRVDVQLAKMVHVPVTTARRRLEKARILSVTRRAKVVLISVSSGWTMIIHLKMSGQLIWRPTTGRWRVGGHPIPGGLTDLPNKFSHVVLSCDGGTLFFNDQRQFGYVKIVRSLDLEAWIRQQGYGPEPLARDFTLTTFLSILDRHEKKRLKAMLLDQTVIAGLGNIYADEACFIARVRPMRRVGSLSATERRALYRGIRKILLLSIAKKGTTADAYRTANGQKGGMMPFLKVYGREQQRCTRGDGVVHKITFVGRGTHYCPTCQR